MKHYSFQLCNDGQDVLDEHGVVIYETGSLADPTLHDSPQLNEANGFVLGTSEWIWLSPDMARRICAALSYFSDEKTEVIERLVKIKRDNEMANYRHELALKYVSEIRTEELEQLVKKTL